jgi:hypothetical protein
VSKENGFLQLRRGLWEHVRDGSLTHTGALVYIYMLTQADTRTGIWKGSAQCVASALNIPKSTAKYALKGLDWKYIRRFTAPGRHVCYPILLHKFLITQGQHIGLMLDALNSADERTLEFYKSEDSQQVVEQVVQDVVQQVGPQRIQDTRNTKREKKKEARAAPSLSFSGQHFQVTTTQDVILGEAFPWIDRPSEYRKADSWLEANSERRPKKANRFLHNWFSRITQPKGAANGKDLNDAVATTMRGAAINSGITH